MRFVYLRSVCRRRSLRGGGGPLCYVKYVIHFVINKLLSDVAVLRPGLGDWSTRSCYGGAGERKDRLACSRKHAKRRKTHETCSYMPVRTERGLLHPLTRTRVAVRHCAPLFGLKIRLLRPHGIVVDEDVFDGGAEEAGDVVG